jgi:hypothetical protein
LDLLNRSTAERIGTEYVLQLRPETPADVIDPPKPTVGTLFVV